MLQLCSMTSSRLPGAIVSCCSHHQDGETSHARRLPSFIMVVRIVNIPPTGDQRTLIQPQGHQSKPPTRYSASLGCKDLGPSPRGDFCIRSPSLSSLCTLSKVQQLLRRRAIHSIHQFAQNPSYSDCGLVLGSLPLGRCCCLTNQDHAYQLIPHTKAAAKGEWETNLVIRQQPPAVVDSL